MTVPTDPSRRKFIKNSAAIAISSTVATLPYSLGQPTQTERKFRLCLNPGAIGVKADQKQLLDYAIQYGYEAMISMPDQLMGYSDTETDELTVKMKDHQITWGSTNLTVDFRKDRTAFKTTLAELPRYAKALQKAGATRMNTWINNGHDELTYSENFEQHKNRLGQSARILGDYGIRLGFEYVGPKTSMTRRRYPFMRSMKETMELIYAIGEPNVGLVLDSFHWFCAEDTPEDILALSPADIITCDLNDARADLSRDEQIDGTRELPAATGVIDLKGYLNALVSIGYDGPIRSEPFNQPLRDMEDPKALEVNMKALKQAMSLLD